MSIFFFFQGCEDIIFPLRGDEDIESHQIICESPDYVSHNSNMEDSTEEILLGFVEKTITDVESIKVGIFPLMKQILRPEEKGRRKNKRIENVDAVQ